MWRCASLPLAVVLAFASCSGAQNTTMCYYCQETDEVCRDPVNVSILPAVRCAELNFVAARAAHVTEHGLAAQINDVIAGDIETRTANLGVQVYQCLKLGVTFLDAKNATAEGILRTCTVAPQDAANFCDLFKEEVTANYTVTSCSVCDGDKCNGSARFGVSALMGVAAAALLGRGLA